MPFHKVPHHPPAHAVPAGPDGYLDELDLQTLVSEVWHVGVLRVDAAGIVELVLLCLGLEERRLPPMPTTRTIDAALKANVRTESEPCRTRFGLTNAFGFGGSNCALVVGAGA